ncbi:hypothetical protein POX_c04213 [Penicillium oxalicum]|uniref:hypothetical protein n=1 Tax=Penicillium oxalicum TaxID=69781 RepID=UPI0020B7077E|nr:hypothetical protein POX_c04213 [Penicillium oxalicum]KAI2791356.1 hypothetical protein POX_c04213 [Penicillium oxalicum]
MLFFIHFGKYLVLSSTVYPNFHGSSAGFLGRSIARYCNFTKSMVRSTESIIRDPERFAKFTKGEQEIINYDHEKDHRRFRKAFHQSLNGTPLLAHESVIRKNCSIFRTKVEKYVQENDGRVDITKLYSWLAFDIAGDLIWREPFDCLKNMKSHPWLAAIELASIGTYVLLVGISPLLQKTIWPFIPKRILDYPRAIVQEKSKTNLASKAHETESAFSFAYRRDILSPEEMEANLIVFVTASSETIHSALLAATGFLGRYKACGRKAREEVRAAFAREEDIVHPAVTELPYLNAVMLETFRLCPAQPTSGPRRVISDSVTIEGEYIPKGTILRTPQYCAGRYSQYFRDPHEFHPERWLNNPLFTSDQLNVVHPFLSGRQSCPGKQVAEMELAHILARMLWAFDWEVEGESWNVSNWKSNIDIVILNSFPVLVLCLPFYLVAKDCLGRTAGTFASQQQHVLRERVECLWDWSPFLRSPEPQFDTIQAASSGGHREIIKLLLDKGADVNAQGGRYENAPCAAAKRGYQEIVKLFQRGGAITSFSKWSGSGTPSRPAKKLCLTGSEPSDQTQ